MPFQKGHKLAKGRKEGTPNKVTKDIREAYKLLIEANLPNLTKWLERIAMKDPERAIRILADLSEYVIPKLARTEHTGEGGKPIETKTTVINTISEDFSKRLKSVEERINERK